MSDPAAEGTRRWHLRIDGAPYGSVRCEDDLRVGDVLWVDQALGTALVSITEVVGWSAVRIKRLFAEAGVILTVTCDP